MVSADSGYTAYGFDAALRTLLRRNCVACGNDAPSCPQCAPDEECTQISGNCNQCPMRTCVKISGSSSSQQPQPQDKGQSTNVGAIAGGVAGGVVFIIVMTYLIWRFCIKNRRQLYTDEYGEEYDAYGEKSSNDHSRNRLSTHSVRSMASTVMTRASNVIQIAFIPGITDRSTHEGHESSIPPVPSIPLRHSSAVTTPYSDMHPPTPGSDLTSGPHYFLPHDLRESHFSDFSSTDADTEVDGRSIRHRSLASSLARESVASTVYHGEATPPAQVMHRGKAAVVSVKSSQTNTPGVDVPHVPAIDYFRYGHQMKQAASSSKLKETTNVEEVQDEPLPRRSRAHDAQSRNEDAVMSNSLAPSSVGDGEAIKEGDRSTKTHSAVVASAIEDATRRATKQPTHGGLGSLPRTDTAGERGAPGGDDSPFSDQHAVSTPPL